MYHILFFYSDKNRVGGLKMSRFKMEKEHFHGQNECIGVLLVNLGTPKRPDVSSVRRYLVEFLSDARVVEIPRLIWLPLLYGIIAPRRAPQTAKLYQSVWMDDGSPLHVYSERQKSALGKELAQRYVGSVVVEFAMRYGKPSIAKALKLLKLKGARRVLVLPLYPQYSATTTATAFDAIAKELRRWRWIPELRFVNQYHDNSGYINALAMSIEEHWGKHDRDGFLLMSFHGLPERNLHLGDPYFCQCQKTARLLAEKLSLSDDRWMITFQSRFGKAKWLQPYTDKTLVELPQKGVKKVDVICPGFASDCLETLEEIEKENREVFMGAGGEVYRYIQALNDHPEHINVLADIVGQHIQGWPESSEHLSVSLLEGQATETQQRAKKKGASL